MRLIIVIKSNDLTDFRKINSFLHKILNFHISMNLNYISINFSIFKHFLNVEFNLPDFFYYLNGYNGDHDSSL